jgi:hypothetical protein
MTKYFFAALLFCIPFLNSFGVKEPNSDSNPFDSKIPFHLRDFTYLRDTVYTLENAFIEIDISKQKANLHFRDGSIKEFNVSTGNSRIKDGIETKEGLYVIHTKAPRIHSVQFDSTLMLNWMGFNYGVGFHALRGKSYYKYLGVKKSSHGCVRISRKIAKEIYDIIKIGTPVLVHNGTNVVHIGFADSSDNFHLLSYQEMKETLPARYKTIYDGKIFVTDRPKLLINKNNVNHSGLPIGERNKIPRRQITTPIHLYVESSLPKELHFDLIKR